MEKETDLKQNGPVVLFNVDRKGRLADYAVCHSDRECGDYLLRQAELALGGAYVPNESVFCLAGAERTDDGLPELLDNYIREGDIRDLPSIDLRSLTFIHETTGGGLPEGMWAILEKTGRLADNPDNRKMLEAYHAYHEKRENALPGRTLSAVRTDKGVLLFDDSGRGLQCLEGSCSTTRTGISPPNFTGWRNWRYTTSVHPINAYRTRPKGAPLCSPCKAGVSSSPKRRVICRTPLWPDSIRQPAVPCMRTVRRSGGLSRPSA